MVDEINIWSFVSDANQISCVVGPADGLQLPNHVGSFVNDAYAGNA